jgi:hypothetical protein
MEMTFTNLCLGSWELLKNNFRKLFVVTLPWFFASAILETVDSYINSNNILIKAPTWILSMVVAAGTSFAGFRYFLNQGESRVQIIRKKIINYCLATIYVGVAIIIGMMLLVIPGLIITALVSFFPLFILCENLGPIEAVSKSVSLMRNCWFKITIFILGLYFLGALLNFLITYALKYIGLNAHLHIFVDDILASLLSLFIFSSIFFIYENLRENRSVSVSEWRGFLRGIDTHVDRERD